MRHMQDHRLRTRDGYSKILFGQCYIWNIFGLDLKSKVFVDPKCRSAQLAQKFWISLGKGTIRSP